MIRPIETVLKPYSEAPTLRAIALAAAKENKAPIFGRRNPIRELAFDRSDRIKRSA